MSVWSTVFPHTLSLLGGEGALLSVSISVEPARLEALLDTLAHLDFPLNPQIYHAPGPATIVEFPAYQERLPQIRRMLENCGFAGASLASTAMLQSIRAGSRPGAAPAPAPAANPR